MINKKIENIQKIISKEFCSSLHLKWVEITDSWEVSVDYFFPDTYIEIEAGRLEDALTYMEEKLNET